MKKNIKFALIGLLSLSCVALASINSTSELVENALDINNNLGISLKNSPIGNEGEVSVSKTYTQFGTIGNRQFLRFATAISGSVGKLTYNRSVDELGLKQKDVVTVYKGIQAGDSVYYYDGERLTTNSESSGEYYWACYTIEFASDTYLQSTITVSLDVEDEQGNVVSSTPAVTSLWEHKNAQETIFIKTVAELKLFRDSVNAGNTYEGKTVKLMDDIDLSNEIWTAIGTDTSMFRGTFDGSGFVIRNLSALTFDYYGNGFFRNVANATIKNVTFEDAYVSNQYNYAYNNCCGIVAGYAYGNTTFENVHIKNSEIMAFGKLGGFVGFQGDYEPLKFKKCSVDGLKITGAYNCGPLGGMIVNESHSDLTINNYTYVPNIGYGYTEANARHVTLNETATADNGNTIEAKGLFWEWQYQEGSYAYFAASSNLYCTFKDTAKDAYYFANGGELDSVPNDITVATTLQEAKTAFTEGGEISISTDLSIDDGTSVKSEANIDFGGNTLSRDTSSGNPFMISTTEEVVINNANFESQKGSAVLATRTDGANITINDSTFTNLAAPSTGNTGVQVYASNTTFTFNNCEFNNMPIITSSSYPENIKLIFNNCRLNWVGDNCPSLIQIGNSVAVYVEMNSCVMTYETNSQYTTAKSLIGGYFNSEDTKIILNDVDVIGTRNNDKVWKIVSLSKKYTLECIDVTYTFNGTPIDVVANDSTCFSSHY